MNKLNDIELPDSRYKMIRRYRHEILDAVCPYCRSMIQFIEDAENICAVCGNVINESEVYDDNE